MDTETIVNAIGGLFMQAPVCLPAGLDQGCTGTPYTQTDVCVVSCPYRTYIVKYQNH